jgi:hypothetical protein
LPDYSDVERIFEIVNESRGREAKRTDYPIEPVTDDEKREAYRWADGNELRNIVDTPGFDILMHKLERYMDEGIKHLMVGTIPTDKDAVLANFAAAHAACEIFERLKIDIAADLEASKNVPQIIKQGIRITRGSPVDASTIE